MGITGDKGRAQTPHSRTETFLGNSEPGKSTEIPPEWKAKGFFFW